MSNGNKSTLKMTVHQGATVVGSLASIGAGVVISNTATLHAHGLPAPEGNGDLTLIALGVAAAGVGLAYFTRPVLRKVKTEGECEVWV